MYNNAEENEKLNNIDIYNCNRKNDKLKTYTDFLLPKRKNKKPKTIYENLSSIDDILNGCLVYKQ
jgi:hypothetical protein